MRVPGIKYDQGNHPQGILVPTAIVLHRTYGPRGDGYAGAYSIGKNGRGGVGIGFHFLVGKNQEQVVQFYDTTTKAAHAKGANGWAVGIEFDGQNDQPLTAWQLEQGARIIKAVTDAHRIPRTYYDGPRTKVSGVLPHASVPGSDHTDTVTRSDWDRMVALMGGAAPLPGPPPPADLAAIAAAIALARKVTLRPGDGRRNKKDAQVRLLQVLLNNKGARLVVDGDYGPATQKVVRFVQGAAGLKVDGIVGPATWKVVAP